MWHRCSPYLGEDYIFENCNFYNKTNINETMRFSFNAYNAYREFTNCKFKSPVNLDKHNEFNSGIFNNCDFQWEEIFSKYGEENSIFND